MTRGLDDSCTVPVLFFIFARKYHGRMEKSRIIEIYARLLNKFGGKISFHGSIKSWNKYIYIYLIHIRCTRKYYRLR